MVYLPFMIFTDFFTVFCLALVLPPHGHQLAHTLESRTVCIHSDVMLASLIILVCLISACLCLGIVVTFGSVH